MYHVIFVYKYRRKVLEPISNKLKLTISYIEKESDFGVLENVQETENAR